MNISAALPRFAPMRPSSSPAEERFDLSAIDTPVEALLMPGVDLVAGLALGQLGDNNQTATLRMTAGDQTVEYTNRPVPEGMDIEGKLNGAAFTLQARPDAHGEAIEIRGDTAGGAIEERLSPVPGGFHLAGRAGSVAFEQSFSLDPMAGFTGHIGDLEGQFGEDALKLSLQTAEDGQSLRAEGSLGSRAIAETITQGPNGTVLIQGSIGSLSFEQVLSQG